MLSNAREFLIRSLGLYVEGVEEHTRIQCEDLNRRFGMSALRQTGSMRYLTEETGEDITMPKQVILELVITARVRTIEDDGFSQVRSVNVRATEADLSSSALETILERALFAGTHDTLKEAVAHA